MPKPNQTMLDKLAETFKSMGKKKPEIIQQTTARDPLGYTLPQRGIMTSIGAMPPMTPERRIYQQGVDEVQRKKIRPILDEQRAVHDEQANLQDKFDEAYGDARERWMAEVEDAVPTSFNMEYGFEPFELQFEAPSFDMREYWPGYFYDLGEFSRLNQEQLNRLEDIDERLERWRGLKGHMMAQTMTPRYRNYQQAMKQREENARLGRLNAAIMNLYRRGYSMPEIREILRN